LVFGVFDCPINGRFCRIGEIYGGFFVVVDMDDAEID
jgi:hypothetical protein